MSFLLPFRFTRLSTRLALTFTGVLLLATAAQAILYFKTRNETIDEADASYQSLAKAIEVATTQIGPEGWKDEKVLSDYTRMLRAKGLRDIQVTEAGAPFPAAVTDAAAAKKKPKPVTPRDILITGVVGEGTGNRVLLIPLAMEGKLYGHIKISYSLENIKEQLTDNFKRRIYALLGVFALGLAIVIVITGNAVAPLDALARGAERVAEGRLDVYVPVDRHDEIGRLAASFNRMAERLRERQELELRLTAAEKRAEIGHLASGLAHEIKNPLNALALGLDVLKRRHSPQDETAAKEYTMRIAALRGEITRLASLINNFLAYGRPLSLTPTETDLPELVDSTLGDLKDLAEKANVTIERRIPEDVPKVVVDRALVKSALWNLVQNAMQSMENSGGTLGVGITVMNGPHPPALSVIVEDTGHGISAEDLPRLFEPYFSRKEAGVGLGLAMVKRIIEDHGGEVFAANREDGPGARFQLTLPLPA